MKTKLSIVQIICAIGAAIIPFIEGSATWVVYRLPPIGGIISESEISLENVMNMQMEGMASLLFWLFYIVLAVTVVYCIMDIFDLFNSKNELKKIANNPAVIALPSLALVLYVIMMIVADNFQSGGDNDNLRRAGVELGILIYIALIPLAVMVLIEIYKQVNINSQNKKSETLYG